MKLFRIFKGRTKKSRRSCKTNRPHTRTTPAFTKIDSDIVYLQGQIGTINIALKKHEDQLTKHEKDLQEYGRNAETLEQKVAAVIDLPPTNTQVGISPCTQTDHTQTCLPVATGSAQKFDISHFSQQQRRILAIFFQNKGRRMSYTDVAAMMGKSAHTVKNQMHQIRRKADLFEKTTGPECRNFFQLREDLRIEKYLNIGQPIARPASTPLSPESIARAPLADHNDSSVTD